MSFEFLVEDFNRMYEKGKLTKYLIQLRENDDAKIWLVSNQKCDKTLVFAFNEEHAKTIVNRVLGWFYLNVTLAADEDFKIYGEKFTFDQIISHSGEFDELVK